MSIATAPAHPTPSLTVENVVPYLLRRNLLRRTDVLGGKFEIQDRTRRNRNFKIIAGDGRGLLIKQVGTSSAENTESVRVEAEWLRSVASKKHLAKLKWLAPRFVHHDEDQGVLITALVHPATSLRKYHLNAGNVQFPQDGAIAAAHLLAGLHRLDAEGRGSARSFLRSDIPFGWTIRDGFRMEGVESGAVLRMFGRLVRERLRFYDRVPELTRRWNECDGLVHGDARWDNFLLTHGSGRGGRLNLRLVDWEHVRRGDSAWDLSYFLADYLRFWLDTAAIRGAGPGKDVEEKAAFALNATYGSTRTFWKAYTRGIRASERERREIWNRVLDYLPFNLAIVAFESIQPLLQRGGGSTLPGATLAALDLAVQAGEEPVSVGKTWFGIEEA